MSSVANIDDLLAAAKALAGTPTWRPDGTSAITKLVAPVSVNGVVGGLAIHASATTETSPQRGSCVLVYEGRPIQRLSFMPDHAHHNPFVVSAPAPARGITLPAGRSRFHSWALNRAWPRPPGDNVSIAELLAVEPGSISEALTIFLAACGIDGDLPPPPWEPRLL